VLAERFAPTAILIEDTSAGIALAQELKQAGQYRVKSIPVDRDKETRLYVQAAKFEAGHVYFPKLAAFLVELETELLTFSQGKHDDQVDGLTQALACCNRRRPCHRGLRKKISRETVLAYRSYRLTGPSLPLQRDCGGNPC
jgi:phage terminase large subunit-like protein